jgi:hypothetical protein
MGEQSKGEMPDLQQPKDGPPFDQNPPAKAKAIDGWVYCNGCEKPQPATGHECGSRHEPKATSWEARYFEAHDNALAAEDGREFAESLLCAMAFDHGVMLEAAQYFDDCEPQDSPRLDWICDDSATTCEPERICVFCDAAREGGR